MSTVRIFPLAILLCLLVACSGDPVTGCEPVGDLKPICGLLAPEDLEVTPDRERLILSQFGGIDGSPGSLLLLDPESLDATPLFPVNGEAPALTSWGAADCPGKPGGEFAPHGIHLSQRGDGRWQLLVVNHGGRESVEFFELQQPADRWELHWRGCVALPPPAYLNDVVALPDGGFLVTHMFSKDSIWALLKTLFGADAGFVLRWSAQDGLSELPGSEGAFPNGIQLSADGKAVFLNLHLGNAVRKLDLQSGEVLGEVEVAHPDNSNWLPDGRLLVASHIWGGVLPELCDGAEGACSQRFKLVAISPETLATEVLLDHSGAPMGAGTAAVQLDDALYVGSYAGDRLLRVPLDALQGVR